MCDGDPNTRTAPPDGKRVARRSLVLAATVCRGHLDSAPADPEARSLHARLTEWVSSVGIEDEMEPPEEAILRASLGELTPQQCFDATWAVEGLAVLAWALGQSSLPKHDEKADPYEVTDAVGFLADDAAEFATTASLRSKNELEACRELLYAIHCRLREMARKGHRIDFDKWIEPEWLALLKIDEPRLVIEDDLAIHDQPLSRIDKHTLWLCESIIRERHRAAIWLIGEHPAYYGFSIDT